MLSPADGLGWGSLGWLAGLLRLARFSIPRILSIFRPVSLFSLPYPYVHTLPTPFIFLHFHPFLDSSIDALHCPPRRPASRPRSLSDRLESTHLDSASSPSRVAPPPARLPASEKGNTSLAPARPSYSRCATTATTVAILPSTIRLSSILISIRFHAPQSLDSA